MSGGRNPIQSPQSWDYVTIAGQQSPAVCHLSGFKRQSQWDKKQGKGAKGATLTYVQRPPAEGTITFLLWTADHFTQWDVFRPLLLWDPTTGGNNGSFEIDHPALADVYINSVVTKSISTIEEADDKGLWKITVDLIEFFPPPNVSAVSTPATAKSDTSQADVAQSFINGPPGSFVATANAAAEKTVASMVNLMSQGAAPTGG